MCKEGIEPDDITKFFAFFQLVAFQTWWMKTYAATIPVQFPWFLQSSNTAPVWLTFGCAGHLYEAEFNIMAMMPFEPYIAV
jgi:hypothetical protein